MKATPTEIENQLEKKLAISYSLNNKFKELIFEINQSPQSANPRGLQVKESLITGFAINPHYPCADFEAREFNYKYFAGELAWYLLKSRKTSFIDKFSNFWKTLKNKDGTINSNYGNILLSKNDETSQMAWVVNALIKDKDSRQAIAYIGGKDFQYEGNKDFVCTQYLLFFIRNNQLHMKVQMRSNDIFYGLTYDAPWFSTVHQNVYQELLETYPDLKIGQYFHFSDNTHFYERHFELAEKIITEETTSPGPKLTLREPLWYSYKDGRTDLSATAKEYLLWFDTRLENIDKLTKEDYINALSTIFHIN